MAPSKSTVRSLSTKLARRSFTRLLLGKNNSFHTSQETLEPRYPIDDDDMEAGSLPRRFSQSSTICARKSPTLTGTTLVAVCSTGQAYTEELSTEASIEQARIRTGERAQSQLSDSEHQIEDSRPEDVDATRPAPPRRTDSGLSQALTASTPLNSDERPAFCSMCGGVFGEDREKAREILVYLPCGHVFGDKCLFRYMSKSSGAGRCHNHPCISIRHMCEHMTMPTTTPMPHTFNDVSRTVLPWNCEFCSSPKGLKLLRSIAKLGAKVRKLEAQKRNRRKPAMDFALNSRLRFYTSSLEQAEKRLDEAQRVCWTSRWDELRVGEKKQRGWSWQRVRGLSQDDADSADT
ncbi:hypothetical protein E4U61_001831 [Claviceps capensis]|nr:hypothetical protein E4U61_001831 [Claviceps capensis]